MSAPLDKDRRTPDEQRRDDLRHYLQKCVAQNIIAVEELWQAPLMVIARLGSTLLGDIRVVGPEIGKGAASAGAAIVGGAFMQLAEKWNRKGK